MKMISQRCPKCHSSRIRAGYRPTPLWSKLLFRFNLLCNNCNWEFVGFAVPGTVSSKSKQSKKKQLEDVSKEKKENSETVETVENNNKSISESNQTKTKKRVKIKIRA